jgi:hypothetical protein
MVDDSINSIDNIFGKAAVFVAGSVATSGVFLAETGVNLIKLPFVTVKKWFS